MIVEVIEYTKDFEAIRDNWNGIYLSDPESHPFLSWAWLKQYLPCKERWFILALRQQQTGGHYQAFLPLEVATYQDQGTGLFCDEILMIGNHGIGHGGFLCVPGLEDDAADAFAGFIATENWTSIRFDCCNPTPARLERLLGAFPDGPFARVENADEGEKVNPFGRRIHSVLVRTRTGRNLHDMLNRRSIDIVFERAVTLHTQGRIDEAEAGYRQVIRTMPGHVQARRGLALLCSDKGDHAEAEHLYRGLLSIAPDADDVRHRLGDSQVAQACYGEASKTFESLLTRHPHRGLVRYKLAVALLAAGRKDAAIAVFSSFEDISSDDPDHIRCKARAREVLWRLTATARGAEEEEPDDRAFQRPISFVPSGSSLSARFLTVTSLLPLEPSLPGGAWARLHAGPTLYGCKGSRLKH
ncbi:tetratricopeptide repeat protein [Ensifer aridi]|uniref:tetratricopeptide repeat protein n=1 Tax=Ensifer aridi TaxID=1708715 RepID=UPI00040708BF|nr:tetratricopeptide repeat protein [Ensifer aridi]